MDHALAVAGEQLVAVELGAAGGGLSGLFNKISTKLNVTVP